MREIKLTQGKVALVDDVDYEELNQYKWWAEKRHNTWYARRALRGSSSGNSKYIKHNVYMHNEIMRPPKGQEVDHVDHNGLNNQRSNMRNCTHAQNGANQSAHIRNLFQYKGTNWNKPTGKWGASIVVSYKRIHLGLFNSEIEAAKEYDQAAVYYFREFAKPNFPTQYNPNWTRKKAAPRPCNGSRKVRMTVDNKTVYLGSFTSDDNFARAYCAAALYFGRNTVSHAKKEKRRVKQCKN